MSNEWKWGSTYLLRLQMSQERGNENLNDFRRSWDQVKFKSKVLSNLNFKEGFERKRGKTFYLTDLIRETKYHL